MDPAITTIRVDFSKVPYKPTYVEALKFIVDNLKLSPKEDLLRVHLRTSTLCAFVDVKDANTAIRVVEQNDERNIIEYKGKRYTIPVTMEDGSVVVKLHDLSGRVQDEEIKEFFGEYGTVREVKEGVWGKGLPTEGLPNGFRYVTMVITKPIPSYVTIAGIKTLTTHRGQRPTCRYCDEGVHFGMTCVNNRKFMQQVLESGEGMGNEARATYACATKIGARPAKISVNERLAVVSNTELETDKQDEMECESVALSEETTPKKQTGKSSSGFQKPSENIGVSKDSVSASSSSAVTIKHAYVSVKALTEAACTLPNDRNMEESVTEEEELSETIKIGEKRPRGRPKKIIKLVENQSRDSST
uniref:Uncharacterized protein n=1 Tax=Anopheles gambiae TaxID=7165 RepID=A0A0E4C7B9_ANOGA